MTSQTLSTQEAIDLVASLTLTPTDFNRAVGEPAYGKIWKASGQVRDYEGFIGTIHVYPTRDGLFALTANVSPDRYEFSTQLLPSLMTEEVLREYAARIHDGMKWAAEAVIEIRRQTLIDL